MEKVFSEALFQERVLILSQRIAIIAFTKMKSIYLGRILKIYRMPSSSRAYPKPLEEKVAIYKKMFEELSFLDVDRIGFGVSTETASSKL